MKKEVLYTYLGTNGTIQSPVHLEDIYYTRKIRLWADPNKLLTKDNQTFFYRITVQENEVDLWYEVKDEGQLQLF